MPYKRILSFDNHEFSIRVSVLRLDAPSPAQKRFLLLATPLNTDGAMVDPYFFDGEQEAIAVALLLARAPVEAARAQ